MSSDPYLYPNTDTLINKLEIKDNARLFKTENDLSGARTRELHNKPVKGDFNLKHLKDTHRHIFQDVYDWAGKVRTVDIAKGGDLFALPHYIDKEANKLFNSLAKENHLKGMETEKFIDRGAHYLSEINVLHPFREGNGRTQQTFFAQLAKEAGYTVDFSKTTKAEIYKVSIASFKGDLEPLKNVLSITSPSLDKKIELLN